MGSVSYWERTNNYDVIRLELPATYEELAAFYAAVQKYELRFTECEEYPGGTIEHVEGGLEFASATDSSMRGMTP